MDREQNREQTYGRNFSGGPVTAVTAGGDTPPHRETVGSALNDQEALLSVVHETLNQLEANLLPVLANGPRATTGGAGRIEKVETSQPGIVQRVNMHNRGLDFLIGRLRDIGERLQL